MSARQRAKIRSWHVARPDYHREWRESWKSWRDSEPANINGGSLPRTKYNKLAYSIAHSEPLTTEEEEELEDGRESVHRKATDNNDEDANDDQ